MRISVVGSWQENDTGWKLVGGDKFDEACASLGREIARRGHTLVIGTDEQHTADYKTCAGIVQAQSDMRVKHPPIMVMRSNDEQFMYQEWRTLFPDLFTTGVIVDSEPEVIKLCQVKESDAVVVIGGGPLSYQAGVAAALSGEVVVPVASFGGAGKRLNTLLMKTQQSWGPKIPSSNDMGYLHNPWSRPVLDRVIVMLGLEQFPRLLIIHGHSDDKLKLKDYLQNTLDVPEPIIMGQRSIPGATLPEKFERLAESVHGCIAILTPDDMVLGGAPGTSESRARENVWIEVGWFWGRLGRDRLLLLRKQGRNKPNIPTDFSGMVYASYDQDPSEQGEEIRRFIESLKAGRRAD
jgi:predicted nucleotide-binding protein